MTARRFPRAKSSQPRAEPRAGGRVGSTEAGLLAALVALAAAGRFWNLASLPPGMHVDEAFNLLDARAVLEGWRPVFLPDNAGRDVLFTYLQASLLAVLGDGLASARAASAAIGTATVPLVWATARLLAPAALSGSSGALNRATKAATRLPTTIPSGGRKARVALLAAALLAGSYWHLHFSRFGIRAILLPLIACAAISAWLRATRETGPVRAVVAGVWLGLAFYAHPAGRGLWTIPLAHALWCAWHERSWRAPWRLAQAGLAMLVVASPLLVYWLENPSLFGGHAGEVMILGGGAAAVADNALRVAGMFNVTGDAAHWRNLPGRPAFDALSGAAMLLGTGLAARSALTGRSGADNVRNAPGMTDVADHRPAPAPVPAPGSEAALLLAWLFGLIAPSVLTDAAPNFSRAIGALPAACILAAIGIDAAATTLARFVSVLSAWTRGLGSRRGSGAAGTPGSGDAIAGRAWHQRATSQGALYRAVIAGVVLAAPTYSAARTARDYFVVWAEHPATPIAFDADVRELAEWWVAEERARGPIFLTPVLARHATVRAVAGGSAGSRPGPRGLDLTRGLGFGPVGTPDGAPHGRAIFVVHTRLDDVEAWREAIGQWEERLGDAASFQTLEAHAGGPPASSMAIEARLDAPPGRLPPPWRSAENRAASAFPADIPRLIALGLPPGLRVGSPADVTAVWRSGGPTTEPLHAAVQLLEAGGNLVASGDDRPLGGWPATDLWREGETYFSVHSLSWPQDRGTVASGRAGERLSLHLGWYYLTPAAGGSGDELRAVTTEGGDTTIAVARVELTGRR